MTTLEANEPPLELASPPKPALGQENDHFWSQYTSNPYFSAGFGLMGLGATLAIGRKAMVSGASLLRRRLLVTLEIPSKDKSYLWFLHWMGRSNQRSHHLAVETAFEQHANGSLSTRFSLVPGPGRHLLRYKGAWIQVQRERDGKLMDITTGTPWETVLLTTLYRDRYIFSELLSEAQKLAMELQQGKTVIFTAWGPDWRPFGQPRRKRTLDSVVLDEGIKERIVADLDSFLNSPKWYHDRGVPYRRGYLLYGPPGSGKSSFIQALAGHLDYSICILNLSERGLTDDKLQHLLSNMPERSIMLLEDVDSAFTRRTQSDESGYKSNVTFSGLLNALDGVASAEERVIFMTTNHAESLDPALIRPGRVDVKEHFDDASPHQQRQMFIRFYEDESKAGEFVECMQGRKITMAALQGLFVWHKGDPDKAIEALRHSETPAASSSRL